MKERFWIELTPQVLSPEPVYAYLGDRSYGAILVFSGTIRHWNEGKPVCAVTYDAFEPLAKRLLHQYAVQALSRWGALSVVARHRVGRVEVGQTSVIVGVGHRHRDEAYQASRFLIEAIKHELPIWKKEHYEDGTSVWAAGCALRSREKRENHVCSSCSL